jgi:hypothetical protein
MFLLGALTFGAGLALDVFGVAMASHTSERGPTSRILELVGLIMVFGAIYGSAAWRFRLWWKTRDKDPAGGLRDVNTPPDGP